MDDKKNNTDCDDKDEIHIEQNILITLNCKRGQTTSTEYYRVLALFTRHCNKWLVEFNKKNPLEEGSKQWVILSEDDKNE